MEHSSGNMNNKSDRVIVKPKLIVFDLDHTLWPFRVDKNTKSPFYKNEMDEIVDSRGWQVKCFPNVTDILERLILQGYQLGIASRITDVCGAYQLLEFFMLTNFFLYKEIYKGSKIAHFQRLREKSGVEHTQMLFFDDDKRNIRDISKLGVIAVQVSDCGINEDVVEKGLELYNLVKSL